MAILSCERKLGGLAVRGLIVCNRLPRRGNDEARSVPMSIPRKLATLIASTLEGSLMVSRLQRNDAPLDLACGHLEEYLEAKVRARQSRAGMDKS
jgi:hypothetical protein